MKRLMLKLVAVIVVFIMTNCSGKGEVSIHDMIPPSVPTGLSGAATSAATVVLNWTASIDNVGVAGYRVYRNGAQINDSGSTSFTDTGLASSTTYFYSVAAIDAANNMSAQSSIVSITTLTVNIPVGSANNNFTMVDSMNNPVGGANDVLFIWDGTTKTAVAESGQVSNATIFSTCLYFGYSWSSHDFAIYGPGAYIVYTDCPAGSPGCGAGAPISFTVGAGELGGHLLIDWGGSTNIDVVNVWKPNAVFAPSPLYAGGCGSNSASTVWGWMSKDVNGDSVNGHPMVDGPFVGLSASFNLIGGDGPCDGVICNDNDLCTTDTCDPATGNCVFTTVGCDDSTPCTDDTCSPAVGCVHTLNNNCTGSANNNFTMLDQSNTQVGGTNDVNFTWDGTMKTSVAASGQVSNATLSSSCPFFGLTWRAHDIAIYGPGIYIVYTDCPAGSPGCGTGAPISFTVGAGELGGHMLFDWGGATNVDVVNVWKPNAVFAPSSLYAGGCGSHSASMVWGWMSKDINGVGVNGHPMVDGPFVGFSANFNLIGEEGPCNGVICNDNDLCTTDTCDPATGNCVFTPVGCDDNNPCTDDTCSPAVGCAHTLINSCAGSTNNNFTMLDQYNTQIGGTNDVNFTWDGTMKTSVAASGQVSNATLSSSCPFFGLTWSAHDFTIYGPGTYIVYTDCPAGSPGCGTGAPISFTVGAGELGGHMLFDWGGATNVDVVNVWKPNAVFAPSSLYAGGCGSHSASTVWGWMSKDVNGDGINGYPMVDGPFVGFSANFNLL